MLYSWSWKIMWCRGVTSSPGKEKLLRFGMWESRKVPFVEVNQKCAESWWLKNINQRRRDDMRMYWWWSWVWWGKLGRKDTDTYRGGRGRKLRGMVIWVGTNHSKSDYKRSFLVKLLATSYIFFQFHLSKVTPPRSSETLFCPIPGGQGAASVLPTATEGASYSDKSPIQDLPNLLYPLRTLHT